MTDQKQTDKWGGGPAAVAEKKPACEHEWDGAPSGNKCKHCGVNYPNEYASSHPAWKADPAPEDALFRGLLMEECNLNRHVWITSLIHGFVCAVCNEPANINNLWPVVVKGSTLADLRAAVRRLTDEIILRESDEIQEYDAKEGEP